MEKEIQDYLREQKQLLEKISQLENRNDLNSQEKVILEEVYYRLSIIEKKIQKFSGR